MPNFNCTFCLVYIYIFSAVFLRLKTFFCSFYDQGDALTEYNGQNQSIHFFQILTFFEMLKKVEQCLISIISKILLDGKLKLLGSFAKTFQQTFNFKHSLEARVR